MIQPGMYSSIEVMDAVMAGEPIQNVPQHWLQDVQPTGYVQFHLQVDQPSMQMLSGGRLMELAHD